MNGRILVAALLVSGVAAGATMLNFTNSSATAAAPATSLVEYEVDPVHTTVVFRINHMNVAPFYGRFNEIDGSVQWKDDDPAASNMSFTIKANSVDTNNGQRDDHLRSPDFFNVAGFPEIRFTSTRIERADGGDHKYKVTGELSLHGQTRTITVDLEKTGAREHPRSGKNMIGFATDFTIKRSDYGMNYGIEQGMVGDEVKLMVGLEALGE